MRANVLAGRARSRRPASVRALSGELRELLRVTRTSLALVGVRILAKRFSGPATHVLDSGVWDPEGGEASKDREVRVRRRILAPHSAMTIDKAGPSTRDRATGRCASSVRK